MKKLFYIEIFPFVPGVTPCFQNWMNFLVGIDKESVPLLFFDQSIFFHKKENTIFFSNQESLAFRSNQNSQNSRTFLKKVQGNCFLTQKENTFCVGKENISGEVLCSQPKLRVDGKGFDRAIRNSQLKTKELLHLLSFPAWYPTLPPKKIQFNIQPYLAPNAPNSVSYQNSHTVPIFPLSLLFENKIHFSNLFMNSADGKSFHEKYVNTAGHQSKKQNPKQSKLIFSGFRKDRLSKKILRNSEKNKTIFLSTKVKYCTSHARAELWALPFAHARALRFSCRKDHRSFQIAKPMHTLGADPFKFFEMKKSTFSNRSNSMSWSTSSFPLYPKDIEILSQLVTGPSSSYARAERFGTLPRSSWCDDRSKMNSAPQCRIAPQWVPFRIALPVRNVPNGTASAYTKVGGKYSPFLLEGTTDPEYSHNQDCTNRENEIRKNFLTFFQSDSSALAENTFFEKIKLEYSYQIYSRPSKKTIPSFFVARMREKRFEPSSMYVFLPSPPKSSAGSAVRAPRSSWYANQYAKAEERKKKVALPVHTLGTGTLQTGKARSAGELCTFEEKKNVLFRRAEPAGRDLRQSGEVEIDTLCFQNIRFLFYYGILYL